MVRRRKFHLRTDDITTAEVEVLLVKVRSTLLTVISLGKNLKSSALINISLRFNIFKKQGPW
jgi:hypothetical protein